MIARRGLSIERLVVILMLCAAPAHAQQVVSTLSSSEGRTESRLARILSSLAPRAFRGSEPCDALASVPEPAIVLTTPDCLAGLDRTVTSISPNVGIPIYFYRWRDSGNPGNLLAATRDGRAPTTVGMLASAGLFRERLASVFVHLKRSVTIEAVSPSNPDLLSRLDNGRYDVIAVAEDGVGERVRQLMNDAKTASPLDALEPVDVPDLAPFVPIVSPALPNRAAFVAAVAVPITSIDPLSRPSDAAPSIVLTLPISAVRADEEPPDVTSSLVSLVTERVVRPAVSAAGLEKRDPRPLATSVPIVVVKGHPSESLLQPLQSAMLAAPLDGRINPCRLQTKDIYDSFLRSAAADAHEPNWPMGAVLEHTQLLQARKAEDARGKKVGPAPTNAKLKALATAFRSSDAGGVCPEPSKRAFFRNDKLAYYQMSVLLLRDVLGGVSVDPETGQLDQKSQALVNQSKACLKRAFDAGETPTCNEPANGLWTTYYAPYLPLAVIKNVESRQNSR